MDSKVIKYLIIFLFISFKAYALEFNGKFIQGHFILGKTEPNSKVIIDKKTKGYMTWNEVKTFIDEGGKVGQHTSTHLHMPLNNGAAIKKEI